MHARLLSLSSLGNASSVLSRGAMSAYIGTAWQVMPALCTGCLYLNKVLDVFICFTWL